MSVEIRRFYAPRKALFGADRVEETGIEVARLACGMVVGLNMEIGIPLNTL